MVELVTSTDMTGFRGAPYAAKVLAAAAESIRTECDWHIAPVITETVKIRTGFRSVILLPTLKLVEVLEITTATGEVVEGWEAYDYGAVERPSGFPLFVNVTFRHGFESCPAALLPLIAERAQSQALGRIKAESLAGRSVQLEGGYDPTAAGVLAKFKLGAASS